MNLWNGCKKAVYGVLYGILLLLSAYVFYGAVDTLKYAEALQGILRGKMVPVFLLGVAALLGIFLYGIFQRIVPLLLKHWNRAVPALFCALILLQLLMVLTVRTSFRYDHLKIFDTALALLEQPEIGAAHFGHYFMKYPNNIPMCLFTFGWMKAASALGLPESCFMELAKLVNLVFMNLGLWFGFSLICRHRSRKTGLVMLLLLLVNPLWYLLGQMYYTSTISLAFSMGALWLYDCGRRQRRLWLRYLEYFCMGVLLAAGFQIRATLIITAAAILIHAVLQLEQIRSSREALSFLMAAAGAVLLFGAYGKIESRYTGFDPAATGYPAIHWVMMSAQGEGQYNSADDAYTGSFETKEERFRADLERLEERLRKMGPGGVLTLFRNKLRVTFSDGTDDYYSLFRTMRETSRVQKYINGGRGDYLALYLHGYHGLLMGLFLLMLLFRAFRGSRDFTDVLALNVCGAYLFYLIWEVDHAYSVPFLLLFLMGAADGMEKLEKVCERFPAVGQRTGQGAAVSGLLLLALFFATGAAMHRSGIPVREYAVLQDQETSQSLVLQDAFVQTFRTGKPFDHVELWVANWDGAANDSVYDLRILDEEGKVAAEGEVTGAAAPCIDAYTVSFSRVVPEREQTYRIEVSLRNPDCRIRTDFLYYQSGGWDMYEQGALYAPELIPDVDLAFAVYEEK